MRKIVFLVLALVLVSSMAAQAAATTIIESRLSGGATNPLFTLSGPAVTTAKSTAGTPPGGVGTLSGTGSFYAGDTTPLKWGDWAFTPATGYGGYYNVYATWATNAYATGIPAPTWTVNNAGTAVNIAIAQTSGANVWNTLATGKKFNAGTTYKTRLTTAGTNVSNKRTYFDSVAWVANTPTAVANTGPANNALNIPLTGAGNNLTWTAGNFNSFFDVFFDTNSNPTTKVGSNLVEGTLSFDPDSLGLLPGTKYFWKIQAKNVDLSAAGTIWNFTTVVPEPSGLIALGTGLLGMVGFMRRRRA